MSDNDKGFRDYHQVLIEALKDPEEAEAYLQVALEDYKEDQNLEAFLQALKELAEAQGGTGELAKKTDLNRQNLYRILSAAGNPKA